MSDRVEYIEGLLKEGIFKYPGDHAVFNQQIYYGYTADGMITCYHEGNVLGFDLVSGKEKEAEGFHDEDEMDWIDGWPMMGTFYDNVVTLVAENIDAAIKAGVVKLEDL